ncbi:MAG: NAD(P)H-binding protein, partial [Planctomycetes bacterium]|nr:NAD(P)H-binding protein [Planctomycetota bacterium]
MADSENSAAPSSGSAWDEELFCRDLKTKPRPEIGPVMVTGASGYIGGRLVPELLARGYRVRALLRAPSPAYEKLPPSVEVVVGDALNPADLDRALKGVHTAYYLIHSLVQGPKAFHAADLEAATNFRSAAQKNKLHRIIYLGGVGLAYEKLSDHLRSRLETAESLKRGLVPVTSVHAAVIIGSGSASYEIVQHLVRNIPVFFIPKWAMNLCQPIGIRDVIKYLVAALETPETTGL